MFTVFTPSFADDENTNAQNLTVKEVVSRLDPSCWRVEMLAISEPDARIAARPNTVILPWQRHGNTARLLLRLLSDAPDVYFFPREGPLDSAFLSARNRFHLKTALVTYVVSGGLGDGGDRPLLTRAIREGDVVAANSAFMARNVEGLGWSGVQIVYDGIDRRCYYPPRELRDSNRAMSVLFAGSLRSYKRADLVVQRAARHRSVEFRLAGAGEQENACRQLAQELAITNIVFLGHLNAEQLGAEMRRADVFFFPSEIEGHPQVLGQAAACGLPCVARDTYQPDYVIDGKTGLLGTSDEELGAALARLLVEPALRAAMSAAAVDHAATFEWRDVTRRWHEIMEQAIANRKRHRAS